MKNFLTIVVISMFAVCQTFGQVYTNKVVGAKNEALKDSLETTEYPYALPILGAKAAKRGYDLPYSAGIGVNYLWQKSDLVIEDLFVGFNNGPMYDLSEVIRFNSAIARASAVNIRPDVWILPFLNVYGLFAKAKHPPRSAQVCGYPTRTMFGVRSPAFLPKQILKPPPLDSVLPPQWESAEAGWPWI